MESLDLVQFIKSQVIAELKTHEKTVADTSTYSVTQKSSGVFYIYVFFTGKIVKGSETKAVVKLDNSHHTAKLAHDAMQELYHESSSSSMLDRMRTMALMKKEEKKGW